MTLDDLKDLPTLIQTVGMWGIWLILFLESCVVFFLPGDSLLFVAGFLASQGYMNPAALIGGGLVAAIAGNAVGYWLGNRYGRRLFRKEKALFFSAENLARTENFYARYGKTAIVIARFIPVVRTFAPVFAGISAMDKRVFFVYNILGALLWVAGLILLGYFLGRIIPADTMEKYLLGIIALIIILSFLPAVVHVLLEKRHLKRTKEKA